MTQPAGGAGSNSPATTKFDSSAYREIDYTELEFAKEVGRGAFGAVWKVGTLLFFHVVLKGIPLFLRVLGEAQTLR